MAHFPQLPDRKPTFAFKWEKYKGKDILPMWVADSEFACAQVHPNPNLLLACTGVQLICAHANSPSCKIASISIPETTILGRNRPTYFHMLSTIFSQICYKPERLIFFFFQIHVWRLENQCGFTCPWVHPMLPTSMYRFFETHVWVLLRGHCWCTWLCKRKQQSAP